MKKDEIKICGYCNREVKVSEIEKEELNLWAPDVGHECDYTEEICPYCGWHSMSIADEPVVFVN